MATDDALALLDLEGGRFAVSGPPLCDPAELSWKQVADALTDEATFLRVVAQGVPMRARDIGRTQDAWCRLHGLLDGDDLGRLIWIVRNFSRELEVDLQPADLHALWQGRRWRRLLNLIDHLPRATWTWQAMANHPEYAEKVAEAIAKKRLDTDEADATPPLVDHTPERAALLDVVDAINSLRRTIVQMNLERGKEAPAIPPYPRPRTLVDTMVAKKERQQRWVAHEKLADRLLQRRRQE